MPTVRGACDACKRRKVKCDRTDFCANCRISRLRCQRLIPPRKRGRRTTATPTPTNQTLLAASSNNSYNNDDDADGEQHHGASTQAPAFVGGSQVPDSDAEAPDPVPVPVPTGMFYQASPGSQIQYSNSPSPQAFVLVSLVPSGSGASPSAVGHYREDSGQIHSRLMAAVSPVLPAEDVLDAIHRYIDLFMQYHFPNLPIVFESTLRAHASLLQPLPPDDDVAPPNPLYSSDPSIQLASMKGFALISAMCASITSVMPSSLIPEKHLLSLPFLHASRDMLRVYEDYDLEFPDSSSLIVRQWHSVALQNTTGKTGSAWHHHGEATLLARRLRLYDEGALSCIRGSRESQLLRASFWQLYLTDVAAIATDTRAPLLIESLFDGNGLTLLERGEREEALLDHSRSCNQGSLEDRVIVGNHFKIRLWVLAASIIQDIKTYGKHQRGGSVDRSSALQEAAGPTHLVEAYLAFTGFIDDLPPWLQRPDTAPDSADEKVCAYQRTCYWAQRCSIVSAFHCLKLIILQCCVEFDMPAIMGFSSHAISLAMKKIEIAHDFLQDLQTVPFLCLKVQGEPAVSRKLRRSMRGRS